QGAIGGLPGGRSDHAQRDARGTQPHRTHRDAEEPHPMSDSESEAPGRPAYALAETLAASLELEQIDRDLYRAVNTVESMNPRSLYGGQVAAQALQAACLTVAQDRFPHSLHGYFL